MTGGVNCGGGRRTRLTMFVVCSSGAPHIYIGWRGGEAAKGAPQVGGFLLGRLPIRPPPFHIHPEGEGRRREAESLPFLLSSPLSFPSRFGVYGGTAAHAGCCISPLGPLGPYLCRGCPEPLSGDPICTQYPRNTYGVRILSSYISIFTSRPFQDSSSYS